MLRDAVVAKRAADVVARAGRGCPDVSRREGEDVPSVGGTVAVPDVGRGGAAAGGNPVERAPRGAVVVAARVVGDVPRAERGRPTADGGGVRRREGPSSSRRWRRARRRQHMRRRFSCCLICSVLPTANQKTKTKNKKPTKNRSRFLKSFFVGQLFFVLVF